jgi:hypothetical protein
MVDNLTMKQARLGIVAKKQRFVNEIPFRKRMGR